MTEQMENELEEWNKERVARENAIRERWKKIHGEPKGRDGGPSDELKEMENEFFEKFKEIFMKYEAHGKE